VRHAPFLVLLLVGAALRLVVILAFRPGLMFLQDSYEYLLNAGHLEPALVRPVGYALFLRVLQPVGTLAVVTVLQHLFALVAAVVLYATMQRLGVRRWVSALATAPLLLDAYQIEIEQTVLAETLALALVVAGLALLLGTPKPGIVRLAAAGAVLAMAVLTRSAVLGLAVPLLALPVLQRLGWRRALAAPAALSVLLLAYAGWFASVHGSFALQGYSGHLLAGRVMPFADCRLVPLPADERRFCPPEPLGRRRSSDYYDWLRPSPLRAPDVAGAAGSQLAGDFARRVIRRQPTAFARTVTHDVVHYFQPGRTTGPLDYPIQFYGYGRAYSPAPTRRPAIRVRPDAPPGSIPYVGGRGPLTVAAYDPHLRPTTPSLSPSPAHFLANYQKIAYTPGPALALCLLLVVVPLPGRLPAALKPLRTAALVLGAGGVGLLVLPAATAVFDYRYLLSALPVLPVAGAAAAEICLQRLGDAARVRGGVGRRRTSQGPPSPAKPPVERRAPDQSAPVEAGHHDG